MPGWNRKKMGRHLATAAPFNTPSFPVLSNQKNQCHACSDDDNQASGVDQIALSISQKESFVTV
jgi:hypothetical protein